MRTQVGIVGAGPAGLMLARLLEREGIESVVLESRSREYVEHRIRAGVLEQGTADLIVEAGVGERMQREGIVHHGIELQFAGERHRIPLSDLAGGRSIVVYGQTEMVKDLVSARLDSGAPLLFEVEDVTLHDLDTERPRIALTHDGAPLATYSARCLARVWRAEHFSWWMTSMLHRLEGGDPFDEQLPLSQLRYVTSSTAAATSLAENYVGLPW